ncbi:MAG TPA: hypothetical protein VFG15_03215 [Amycolatopsis sp.]|nr:hypothetical protein [Amycolatopsis sp.]
MGNSSEPGTVTTREIEHDPITVDGERVYVTELHWNGINGRSFEVTRAEDGEILTADEAFDNYPTDEQIRTVLQTPGTVECKFCGKDVPIHSAHPHQGTYVGDECCWDERLRSTE